MDTVREMSWGHIREWGGLRLHHEQDPHLIVGQHPILHGCA
jgi:hypothetical protein